jgi:hypothetical protein
MSRAFELCRERKSTGCRFPGGPASGSAASVGRRQVSEFTGPAEHVRIPADSYISSAPILPAAPAVDRISPREPQPIRASNVSDGGNHYLARAMAGRQSSGRGLGGSTSPAQALQTKPLADHQSGRKSRSHDSPRLWRRNVVPALERLDEPRPVAQASWRWIELGFPLPPLRLDVGGVYGLDGRFSAK